MLKMEGKFVNFADPLNKLGASNVEMEQIRAASQQMEQRSAIYLVLVRF